MPRLGRLEKVGVRQAWPGEASDFTPWLALEENLALLSEEIDAPLELIELESGVGSFRADILARHQDTYDLVVIENQFGKTDHGHLGQLLTYAAGFGQDGGGARTVIWIAEKFTEPHRAAIDWLNKCTEPGMRFFGVELQLWRIGNSAFAPSFSLVSRPNNWQKTLAHEIALPSSVEHLYFEFWTGFVECCKGTQSKLRLPNAWSKHWLPTHIGKAGFRVNFTVTKQKKRIGCELYLTGSSAKLSFAELLKYKETICSKLQIEPEFQELPTKEASRIVQYSFGDVEDRTSWPEMHQWLKLRGEAFVETFTSLVKQLDVEESIEETELDSLVGD